MLPAAKSVFALLIGLAGLEAHADATSETFSFEEYSVEFHNQNVKLAGSLLLPRSEVCLLDEVVTNRALNDESHQKDCVWKLQNIH